MLHTKTGMRYKYQPDSPMLHNPQVVLLDAEQKRIEAVADDEPAPRRRRRAKVAPEPLVAPAVVEPAGTLI